MNRLAYQQNTFMGACVSPNDVVCPKPRRIGITPLFFNDIIRSKGSSGSERSNFQLASSPPFFNGSPPTRTSNPLIKDEQFVNGKVNTFSPSTTPTHKSGSCNRINLGTKPAPVRIEGFNCHDNCRLSTVV